MDPLDQVISAFIILFILSIITEKIVSLYRCYPRHGRLVLVLMGLTIGYGLTSDNLLSCILYFSFILMAFLYFWFRKDLREGKPTLVEGPLIRASNFLPAVKKVDDSHQRAATASPDIVERQVFALSFFLGVVVAFLFHADLIEIFTSGHLKAMSWGEGENAMFRLDPVWFKLDLSLANLGEYLLNRSTVGILLTGFFLSFGSKFFHDLIDTLLQVKNLKRKLNQKETYELERIEDLNAWLKSTNGDIVKAAYEKQADLFKGRDIQDIALGTTTDENGKRMALHVYLTGEDTSGLPQVFNYALSTGTTVPVHIVYHLNTEKPKAHAVRGDTIFPANGNIQHGGSMGVVVMHRVSGRRYLVTCSHVANNGSGKGRNGYVKDGTSMQIIDSGKGMTYKEALYYDSRNGTEDVALVGELVNLYSNINNGTPVTGSREIRDADIHKQIPVAFYGKTSGYSEGLLSEQSLQAVNIEYSDGDGSITGLFKAGKLAGSDWSAMSHPGDSGSLVFDKRTNEALGIVVAGNNYHTYFMPIKGFLDTHNLEIA